MERRSNQISRQQSRDKAAAFDVWILKIRQWLNNLFGRREAIKAAKVLVTHKSELVLIRGFETSHSDDVSTRIQHWVLVSLLPEIPYDIVIVCDRLKRTQQEISRGDLTGLTKSHRVGIFRKAHYASSGRRMDQVFVGDFDFVQTYAYHANFGLDGYAHHIVASVAIDLKYRKLWEVKLLFLFASEGEIESQQTRLATGGRWESLIVSYYRKYFPNHRENGSEAPFFRTAFLDS